MPQPILHITLRSEWEAAQAAGHYTAPSLHGQGFIHCSFPHQVERVANKFYAEQNGLVLLVIDPHRLASELRMEEAIDVDDEFPHIYGPINLDAVVQVVDFPASPDGQFHLPEGLK